MAFDRSYRNLVILIVLISIVTLWMLLTDKVKNESLSASLAEMQTAIDSLAAKESRESIQMENQKALLDSVVGKNQILQDELDVLEKEKFALYNNSTYTKELKTDEELRAWSEGYEDLLGLYKNLCESYIKLEQEDLELLKILGMQNDRIEILRNYVLLQTKESIDNVKVEGMTERNKLEVRGSRIKKLIVNFSVSSELKDPTARIFDADEKLVPAADNCFDWKASNSGNDFAFFEKGNRSINVEATYTPTTKLHAGIYKMEIHDGDWHIGSVFFRLK